MTQNSNGVIILITLLNILVYKLQQLQEAKFTEQTNQLSLSLQKLCRRFSLRDIQWATFNFHDELVIGQGGFGKVYKGIIDFGATTVAIKRLKSGSKQGPKEFLTEIEMLSKFQHSHLVSLVGYCDDCHEMILVYEYMPCGTLADHLHKRVRKGDTSSPPLSWEQRLKICIGAARGLDYLHTGTSVQHRVIHRDVKSSNILLDENMAAKISDFGLSKIGPSNQPFSTYVSTHVKGTPGYLDPYYFATHTLTRKSDVYGLGVVLFEALSGRRAVDNSLDEEQRGLAGWAQHCFKEGLLEQIIDPSIKGKILPNSLLAFVRVASQCLHNAPKHRPTMAEVVVGLESALALQERGTIYTLVETPITNCEQVNVTVNANSSKLEEHITKYNQEHVDSSMVGGNQGNLHSPMVEVENANHNEENKNCSVEEGVINDADGGHHDEQSPARMTFTEKIGLFLFGKARMFSGHSDSRIRRSHNNRIMAPNLKRFTLAELRQATRGFRSGMRLGKGGVGTVYKGWVHEKSYAPSKFDVGMAIAIKRLHSGNTQGFRECQLLVQTEIEIMGNYSHPNLVKLLGYCQEDKELLLVYEYMQKGSLYNYLCNSTEEFRLNLDWPTRYKICIGIARGLAYLHEESRLKIIHRDIKATNVLLDKDLNPKISDFGLAKLDEEENSHISTRIIGTFGYLAPEYAMRGYLTDKADVYSFGIVALEILSGRINTSFRPKEEYFHLLDWALTLKEKGSFMELVDERLGSEFNEEEVMVMINVALQCASFSPTIRPAMSSVVGMLEGRAVIQEFGSDKSVSSEKMEPEENRK